MDVEARVDRLLALFIARVRGDGGGWNRRDAPGVEGADLPDERVAVLLRHGDVGEQHVDLSSA